MIADEDILRVCDRIVSRFRPQCIGLFGSHAYGKPGTESDADLLVVLPYEGRNAAKTAEILGEVHTGFPLDIVVRSPEEIRRRLAHEDFFLREITTGDRSSMKPATLERIERPEGDLASLERETRAGKSHRCGGSADRAEALKARNQCHRARDTIGAALGL